MNTELEAMISCASGRGYDISIVAVVDVLKDIHFYRVHNCTNHEDFPKLDAATAAYNTLASIHVVPPIEIL